MTDDQHTPLIVTASPLEFVLIGNRSGYDEIVVSSQGAGLDLVGLAARNLGWLTTRRIANQKRAWFWSMLGAREECDRMLWSVTSGLVEPDEANPEHRKVDYRFCWVGTSDTGRVEHVKQQFDRIIDDLHAAIVANSPRVSWFVGVLIMTVLAVGLPRDSGTDAIEWIRATREAKIRAEVKAQSESIGWWSFFGGIAATIAFGAWLSSCQSPKPAGSGTSKEAEKKLEENKANMEGKKSES